MLKSYGDSPFVGYRRHHRGQEPIYPATLSLRARFHLLAIQKSLGATICRIPPARPRLCQAQQLGDTITQRQRSEPAICGGHTQTHSHNTQRTTTAVALGPNSLDIRSTNFTGSSILLLFYFDSILA